MHTVLIVAIVFGSIVTIAGLICGTVLVIFRTSRTGFGRHRQERQDEAKMVQELYRGLENMEQRIEALETILMEGQEPYGDRT